MQGRIIVHGGAGQWEEAGGVGEEVTRCLRDAVEAGLSAMRGGSAADAVVEAVAFLEGTGAFLAGRGALPNLDGDIELDAGLMDGETLRAGGVAAVRSVPHPIRLARIVMERTEHVLIAAQGAEQLAGRFGLTGEIRVDPSRRQDVERKRREYLASPAQRWAREFQERGSDTVGAVAMDAEGRFAAATSTGGLAFKLPGRVGDSPLVGHGYYAMRGAGAASTSGIGEAIARYGLSLRAVLRMGEGVPAQDAAEDEIAGLSGLFGPDTAGIILLDRNGSPGVFFNTGGMAVGYGRAGTPPEARVVMRGELEGFSDVPAGKMREG